MRWIGPFVVAIALAGLIGGTDVGVAAPLESVGASAASATDLSAQSRPRRARTRIRVTPYYPYRHFHSPYPLPYDVEYPGPNVVRECQARLVPEARPSGTVIVPRTRCWWVPG